MWRCVLSLLIYAAVQLFHHHLPRWFLKDSWHAAVHGVTKSQTRLGDFTFTFHFHALEKEMATRSSVLAWKIPGTVEPNGLPSWGRRVGHDWSDLAAAAAELTSREGNGTQLQYSCLETPRGGGTWSAAVHGVARSRTRLSDFIFTFHYHALEKEITIHSSVLAWRISGTGKSGGLPSLQSHRVGHNWSDLAVAVAILLNLLVQEKGISINSYVISPCKRPT